MAFHPDPSKQVFAAGSWDGSLILYEIKEKSGLGMMSISQKQFQVVPIAAASLDFGIIDLKWLSNQQDALCVTVGTGAVFFFQAATQQLVKVVEVENLLYSSVVSVDGNVVLLTVSTNKFVKFWALSDTSRPLKTIELRYPVLCADSNNSALILGLGNNYVGFLKFSSPDNFSYLSLNLDILANCIAFSCQSFDFVIGTLDGRILVGEVVVSGENRTLNRKIAFKAHKSEERFDKKLFVVNSVGFTDEKRLNGDMVYSCGHEGTFKLWDLKKRETVFDLSFTKKITCSAVSPDKKFVAIAFGYDWSSGVWGLKEELTPIGLGIKQILLN